MLIKPEKLTKTQKIKTLDRLFEESTPNYTFFLMLAFSTVIVTVGILFGNIAVVIGGMLVTPLLSPILSIAMGVVVADVKLIKRSSAVLTQSTIIVIVMALLISLLALEKNGDFRELIQLTPNLPYLIIALISGAAVAYAVAQPMLSATLPGVAIAVALLPPLASVGIALSEQQWNTAINAFGLFTLNLIGIVLAAVVTFSMLTFHEVKNELRKKIKAEEQTMKKEEEEQQQQDIKKLEKTVKQAEKVLKKKK